MKKLTKQFPKPTFHLLLFGLCLVFFSWPFLTIADRKDIQWAAIGYIFFMWFFMIFLLFLIGRRCRKDLAAQELADRKVSQE